MSPERQAEMRANGSRSGKTQRVINSDLGRKRCNRPDTGYGHQAAAGGIVLNHLQRYPMQFGVSSRIARRTSSIVSIIVENDIRALDQLAHARVILAAAGSDPHGPTFGLG
jgi:hypothetical protein